jgi:autotransporter-associated beta strand protein
MGAGGAVFVRQGATINFIDSTFSGNTVVGGTGGNSGQAIGEALFLAGSTQFMVNSGVATIANTIGGGTHNLITGGLVKSGQGDLVLTGANTYTGGTIVNAGTLRVNNSTGSGTGNGLVTVQNGGNVGGAGTIAGNVVVNSGGSITPGNGSTPSALSVLSGVDLAEGSNVNVVAGVSSASVLTISGALDVAGGTRSLTLFTDGTLIDSQTYTFTVATMTTTAGFSGTSFEVFAGNFGGFASVPEVTNPGGTFLQVQFTPVPEPTLAITGSILSVVLLRSWRLRRIRALQMARNRAE